MIFIWRILNSLELDVELPMILEIDNKGAVDLCNNWAVAGRTRHIDVRQLFVRDLKEAGIIKVVWRKGEEPVSYTHLTLPTT